MPGISLSKMNNLVENSLLSQTTCPKCSVSWTTLQKDLETESVFGSYALDEALTIIGNCNVCQIRFRKQMDIIDIIYKSRRLDKQGITTERI